MKLGPLQRVLAAYCCGFVSVALGVAVTVLAGSGLADAATPRSPAAGGGALLVAAFTCVAVSLRWVRWHFLTRRAGAELGTIDSWLTFAVTLPAAATRFYVGELLRIPLLDRKYPGRRASLFLVWLLERSTDFFLLALLLAVTRGSFAPAAWCGVAWIACGVLVRAFSRRTAGGKTLSCAAMALLLPATGLIWLLPAVGAAVAARQQGIALGWLTALDSAAFHAWSYDLTSGLPVVHELPLGLLIALRSHGVASAAAKAVAVSYAWGTTGFVVAAGSFALVTCWSWLAALVRYRPGAMHFDAIAEEYEEQIPEHLRRRLLGRKIEVMQRHLAAHARAAGERGLDFGCGQGWYADEMARLGFDMVGVDQSARQIAFARRNAGGRPNLQFQTADGSALPFADETFDFAYAINALHHIIDAGARQDAWRELLRVLKPGGVFFLHEINTANPLFRFYMGYLFPLLRTIDEGTERWIHPMRLPPVAGAHWKSDIDYLTFFPDFVPSAVQRRLAWMEAFLERSTWRSWSAHYVARLAKDARASGSG